MNSDMMYATVRQRLTSQICSLLETFRYITQYTKSRLRPQTGSVMQSSGFAKRLLKPGNKLACLSSCTGGSLARLRRLQSESDVYPRQRLPPIRRRCCVEGHPLSSWNKRQHLHDVTKRYNDRSFTRLPGSVDFQYKMMERRPTLDGAHRGASLKTL